MKRLLRLAGLALCVLPPAIATLEYFPIWLSEGESALSALAVILLLLSALPLLRLLRRHLRSISAWMLWLTLWLLLLAFRPIAAALEIIALISFPTSLLGALLLRIGEGDGKGA